MSIRLFYKAFSQNNSISTASHSLLQAYLISFPLCYEADATLDEASGYAISEKESTDASRNISKFRPFYEIEVQEIMAIEKGGGLEKTLRNHEVDFPFLNACCSIIGN